jgi:hypothetical protein
MKTNIVYGYLSKQSNFAVRYILIRPAHDLSAIIEF